MPRVRGPHGHDKHPLLELWGENKGGEEKEEEAQMTEEPVENEEEFVDWECDECMSCECIAYKTICFEDGETPEKWLCVGRIKPPEKPRDLHEALNQVRFCRLEDNTMDKIDVWEGTPYEALVMSGVLQYGVIAVLNDQQNENHQKLKALYGEKREEK